MSVILPEQLTMNADRGRVKQVLINLVMNALEAMAGSAEKRLLIEAGQESGEVWLSVADTGEGMQEEQLNRLFEPFYTSKAQGIGLGLYVSQKIMREHGGRMEVSSVRGQGAVFTLRFGQTDDARSGIPGVPTHNRMAEEDSHAQLVDRR